LAKPKALPNGISRGCDGRYRKPCARCGEEQSYLRRNYAIHSLMLGKVCHKCSRRDNNNCHRGWHRGIRISWFNKCKACAETRGLEFSITIDDVADLYEKQGRRCSLTGWEISFPDWGLNHESHVSIDRIDSKGGYTTDNIQLVHKSVNMMKQNYSQQFFIEVCCAVSQNMAGALTCQ
jgi:hypothetical protein